MRSEFRPGTAAAVFSLALLAAAPLGILAVYSFARSWFWPSLAPSSWDLHAWRYVISAESGVAGSLAMSAGIALAVTIVAVAVSLPAARVLAWHPFAGKRILLFVFLLPVLSPPLAAAMGLHALFLRIGLTETAVGVGLVHLIPAVPYAILVLTGSYTRLDPDLEEQARTLGASRWQVLRRVTFPSIAPGLAVAASIAFLISWSQYLLTLLVGGGRTLTLPLTLVSFLNGGDGAIAAALGLIFVVPPLFVFMLVARYLRYEA